MPLAGYPSDTLYPADDLYPGVEGKYPVCTIRNVIQLGDLVVKMGDQAWS